MILFLVMWLGAFPVKRFDSVEDACRAIKKDEAATVFKVTLSGEPTITMLKACAWIEAKPAHWEAAEPAPIIIPERQWKFGGQLLQNTTQFNVTP